jgi:CRP-like cAMP-binding protein
MVSIDALRQCELFADLNDEELGQIAQICCEETHEPQEVICGESEVADKVYILHEGRVAVQMYLRSDLEPNGDVLIEEVTPGRIFGWSALVRQRRFTASVRSLERARVIAIKSADLNALFEENAHIGFVVMKRLADVISSRLRRTRQQLGGASMSNLP